MNAGRPFDVAILGAGFGGSLLAMVLRQQGLSVALVDRQFHPRFAIGESSTPAADFILERLSDLYSLPRLRPLARYGSWQRAYPRIPCGLKRGFSYFHHQPGQPFETDRQHSNVLLVTASDSDDVSDTHWFRADVDAFFAAEARALGALVEEGVDIEVEPVSTRWRIRGARGGQTAVEIDADFIVDAAGGAGVLPRLLNLGDRTSELRTSSRALYAHFTDLPRWEERLQAAGYTTHDYPFGCDDAALHHVIDGGWMWVLRFNNGVTSAGFSLDSRRRPLDDSVPPHDEFRKLLGEYPSLGDLFRRAPLASSFPAKQPVQTRRSQRLWAGSAGSGWCLLPSAAGFIDAFYSTGIAQTLCGVLRLGEVFQRRADATAFSAALEDYSQVVDKELRLIDRLVALAFSTMGRDPGLLHAATAVYFAAATTFERRFHDPPQAPGFLLADEPAFRGAVGRVEEQISEAVQSNRPLDLEALHAQVAGDIRDYNAAGLLTSGTRLYCRTSAKA